MKFFYEEERRWKAGEEKGHLKSLIPKALDFEAKESAIRTSEERDKSTSMDTSDSSENPVHVVSDISPSSAEPKHSLSRTSMRYRRIPKRCFKCNSIHHLQRFCDKAQNIASQHTRRSHMTALFNCFRCGSKRHQTAECFRNHKICFR